MSESGVRLDASRAWVASLTVPSSQPRVECQLCMPWEPLSAKINKMSLAEVGLALESHFLTSRSEPTTPVVHFGLRHSGLERRGMSKDILPFPLSAFPTAAEISLSLDASRAQLGHAEEAEAALDEYNQEAGLEAWTFLVTRAFNFVYSGWHVDRAERPETFRIQRRTQSSSSSNHLRSTETWLPKLGASRGGIWSDTCH